MNKRTSRSGYSLIEIIIYVAIFALLAVVVIDSVIVVVSSFNETRTNRDLLESGNSSFERVSREIRQAKSIDVADSTLASSPGVLVLNTTDARGNPRVVKFAVVSGALDLYEGTTFAGLSLTGNLIDQNIHATSLVFRQITTTAGGAVKIEMTLQDQRGKERESQNFYDTIILRNEY